MKIGIVGCGNVGSASAYACVMLGVGTELVLVDSNAALAKAQAEDILHATPFAKSMPVSSGSYEALAGCGIVMIAAGAHQKHGENRLDLLKRNADLFSQIIPKILDTTPQAILLVASNPVDIMTHMASYFATQKGHTKGNVIGSGTILDTARFRTQLAHHLDVSSHSVHAHVLGEHGDSEVLHWSGVNISNIRLDSGDAIRREAINRGIAFAQVNNVSNRPSAGIVGNYNGQQLWAGNLRLAAQMGGIIDHPALIKLANTSQTIIYMGLDSVVLGAVSVADQLRPTSVSGIAMGVAGSDVALQAADVALLSEDIGRLAEAHQLAQKTAMIIRQNLTFSKVLCG